MFIDSKKAVETRFKTEWVAAQPSVPFGFDNVDTLFLGTGAVAGARDGLAAFVVFSIQGYADAGGTIGQGRVIRKLGEATVQVFVRRGDGAFKSAELAEAARAIFEDWSTTLNGTRVVIQEVATQTVGDDGRFQQTNVMISFKVERSQ